MVDEVVQQLFWMLSLLTAVLKINVTVLKAATIPPHCRSLEKTAFSSTYFLNGLKIRKVNKHQAEMTQEVVSFMRSTWTFRCG